MKKLLISIIVSGLVLISFSGCEKIKDLTLPESQNVTQDLDKLYRDLSEYISNPESLSGGVLAGTLTFSVCVLDEPMTLNLEGEDHLYQSACISRNIDQVLLMEVDDLTEYPAAGSYISVTGTVTGSVYWIEKNQQEHVLDFKVASYKPLEQKNIQANTGIMDVGFGTVEFKGAHYSSAHMNMRVIVLYYEFTNTDSKERSPSLGHVELCIDGVYFSKTTIFPPKELDEKALVSGVGSAKTYPGKTSLYYAVYELPENASGTSVSILRYDDDFNTTDNITVDLARSLSAMQ
ncbi:MAG: hypothetical protein LBB49_00220 [Gracilibacteraceae bacterium]|jgi:hypothetical protein|nr:hypothetical protein [Gracilibacteraceae bacterium]